MNRLNMVKHQNKEDNSTIMKKIILQEKNKHADKQSHRDNLDHLQRGNHQSGIRFSLSKNWTEKTVKQYLQNSEEIS